MMTVSTNTIIRKKQSNEIIVTMGSTRNCKEQRIPGHFEILCITSSHNFLCSTHIERFTIHDFSLITVYYKHDSTRENNQYEGSLLT